MMTADQWATWCTQSLLPAARQIEYEAISQAINAAVVEERERICKLLTGEIPGLQARESHDGGPSLTTLIEELVEKIKRVP